MSRAAVDYALRIAKLGGKVIPLDDDFKPRIRKWQDRKTSEPRKIENWDAPAYGWVAGDEFVHIDCDAKNGLDGYARLQELAKTNSPIPSTLESETKSKGRHLSFRIDGNTPPGNSVGAVAPGIDVRSGNGYIVLPGAKGYKQVSEGMEIAEIPGWLYELTAQASKFSEYAALTATWTEDQNNNIYHHARMLAKDGKDPEWVLKAMLNKWRGGGIPNLDPADPWTEAQITAVVIGGTRDGVNDRVASIDTSVLGWEPLSMGRMMLELPEYRAVVDGMLYRRKVAMLAASPGVFKSKFASHIIMCVAMGRAVMMPLEGDPDGRTFPTTQGPVVLIDFDNGTDTVHEQLRAAARGIGADETVPVFAYSMPEPWLEMKDKEMARDLIALIKSHGAVLVVFDTLADISIGLDENTAEMSSIMANIRWLAEETDAAVLILHHTNKANYKEGVHKIRGSTVLAGKVDLALGFTRGDERHPNDLHVLTLKARGARISPFAARFTYDYIEDRKQLDWYRFESLAVRDQSADDVEKSTIARFIMGNPKANQTKIAEGVEQTLGISRNVVRDHLKDMVRDGWLAETVGSRGSILYTLLDIGKAAIDFSDMLE